MLLAALFMSAKLMKGAFCEKSILQPNELPPLQMVSNFVLRVLRAFLRWTFRCRKALFGLDLARLQKPTPHLCHSLTIPTATPESDAHAIRLLPR